MKGFKEEKGFYEGKRERIEEEIKELEAKILKLKNELLYAPCRLIIHDTKNPENRTVIEASEAYIYKTLLVMHDISHYNIEKLFSTLDEFDGSSLVSEYGIYELQPVKEKGIKKGIKK